MNQRTTRKITCLQRRVGLALPVRVTSWDEKRKPRVEMACTYDVSAGGVRLGGLRHKLRVGDIVLLERGRNKMHCRVVWAAQSGVGGQMGLQGVELGKSFWEAELKDAESSFELVAKQNLYPVDGKRRASRYEQEAAANVARLSAKWEEEPDTPRVEGQLLNISMLGCQLRTSHLLVEGTKVRIVLNFEQFSIQVRGVVRHSDIKQAVVGIEFSQIRRGDRRLLQHFLMQLSATEQVAAVGHS